MKINSGTAVFRYEANVTMEQSSNVKNKTVTNKVDSLELSRDGMQELQESKSKTYDLNEVMRIHKKSANEIPTREESAYYWEARKNDPALDARLYAEDKAEALEFVGKVQLILMKAASGQPLTPEEKELVKNDPALQQEIQKRKL